MKMQKSFCILFWISSVYFCHARVRQSRLSIANNGFQDLLVSIDEAVPEDAGLIEKIKNAFRQGSLSLYGATRQRAYFESVVIRVPKSWSQKAEYQRATWESHGNADVLIAEPTRSYGHTPYVLTYEGCGQGAEYMHLTPDYLTDPDSEDLYGPVGKVLVHEFAHLRWGVFDEYADQVADGDAYQPFYIALDGNIKPTICSTEFNGIPLEIGQTDSGRWYNRYCAVDPVHGYNKECSFLLTRDQQANESFMCYQFVDSVHEFCDSSTHNGEAPNKQNRLCNGKSVWEVLSEHDDFSNNNNLPRNVASVEPNFRIVQPMDERVVIVIDVSGSMAGDRIANAAQAAANYITSIVTDCSSLAVVQFSTYATVNCPLTKVTNDAVRQLLVNCVPTTVGGGTSIGAGLTAARNILGSGGLILLISDGGENSSPYILDVQDSLVAAGITVDTVTYSNAADAKLEALSFVTGGISTFYSGDPSSNSLQTAFLQTMRRDTSCEIPLELYNLAQVFGGSDILRGNVFIDKTVGADTEFTFTWHQSISGQAAYEVTLESPSGNFLNRYYLGYGEDLTFRIIKFRIADIAESGTWNFVVRNKFSTVQNLKVTITSRPHADDPIVVRTSTNAKYITVGPGNPMEIYTQVSQGLEPVLGAEVIATIERPSPADPVVKQLFDNGAGADVTKSDGVYSGYFTEFTTNGRYGVSVTVKSDGSATVGSAAVGARGAPAKYVDNFDKLPTIGNDTAKEENETQPIEFERSAGGGGVNVEVPPGYNPVASDIYSPGKILDLRVADVLHENFSVVLTWTATGDDYDTGTASEYDLRISTNLASLRQYFSSAPVVQQEDLALGSLTSPQSSGNSERFIVRVSSNSINATYSFAIRAIDEAGNAGDPSNAVSATFIQPVEAFPTIPLPIAQTTEETPTTEPQTTTEDIPTTEPQATTVETTTAKEIPITEPQATTVETTTAKETTTKEPQATTVETTTSKETSTKPHTITTPTKARFDVTSTAKSVTDPSTQDAKHIVAYSMAGFLVVAISLVIFVIVLLKVKKSAKTVPSPPPSPHLELTDIDSGDEYKGNTNAAFNI